MYNFAVSNVTEINFDRIIEENDGVPCAIQGGDGLIVILPVSFLAKFCDEDNQWLGGQQLGPNWGRTKIKVHVSSKGDMRLGRGWSSGYATTPASDVRLVRTGEAAKAIGRQLAAVSRYLSDKTITVKVLVYRQIFS